MKISLPESKFKYKDQPKADMATCFIGQGSSLSSTNAYALAFSTLANKGQYTNADRVFVSAEGRRNNRLNPHWSELSKAIDSGCLIITDKPEDRARAYNLGERQVAGFLKENHYHEYQPGKWLPCGVYRHFSWSRDFGYEVSSLGDKTFSVFYAKLHDGHSIEQHYQCDVKGHDRAGVNWRLGKDKKPPDPQTDLWSQYLDFWRKWAKFHLEDLRVLFLKARENNNTLRDSFAKTPINQAHALAVILNDLCRDQFFLTN